MDQELRRLLEKDKIITAITQLFVETDNRDWERVKACFASQVRFDMSSLTGAAPATLSPAQIADAWDSGLRPLKAVHHQAGNYEVTLDGSTARAFCYATASHYLPNPSGHNTRVFVGSYDFHLTSDGQRWLIDAFRFNLKYLDGNLHLEQSA